ncbi:hypothetical protein [Candidatus Tisiphia endosymbiont of Temnostethus pusillus]|uniref:hypothetical protein n=1 Tax=Candidatus Tisiphia endosymbiont of Temnostethus pusillus TaxID=3139335 RepID=UPI0035C8C327
MAKAKLVYMDRKDNQGNQVLSTPINLYNEGVQALGESVVLLDCKKVKEANGGFKVAASSLKEALTFGEGYAAAALAYIYSNGYGVKKDYTTAKLYILIGEKLGSQTCADFMQGKNDEVFDIKDFLKANPNVRSYSRDIINRAEKLAQAARENAQEYTKQTIMTNEILGEAVHHFEQADPLHAIKVFEGFTDVKVTGEASSSTCEIM